SRSGVLTVAAGKSTATQAGVALTRASLVLATVQQDRPGVWVRSAVPAVTAHSFTVHLSRKVPARTRGAWFGGNRTGLPAARVSSGERQLRRLGNLVSWVCLPVLRSVPSPRKRATAVRFSVTAFRRSASALADLRSLPLAFILAVRILAD